MKQVLSKPELLSPAGNFEKMLFAFHYGADAVYAGGKNFSLREGAANFTTEELSKAVKTAHDMKKKFFLTANIFYHDRHIQAFREYLEEIKNIPLDGIICSDLGAISYVRENYPELPVHVSTQANTTNSESIRFFEKLGVKRVILARELTINEIKAIRDKVGLELESFIHGAMCIAYSGRCLLSNYFTNPAVYRAGEKMGAMKKVKTRDANLGDCAQSCRWHYTITETTRPGEAMEITEEEYGTSILSSKDMNLSAHMIELIDAGIDSFKIEGRMKSLYYAANVTRVYRRAIDDALKGKTPPEEILAELSKVSHREYTTGFFLNENLALSPTTGTGYQRECLFLGQVLKSEGKGKALIRTRNQIRPDMQIEAILPDCRNIMLSNIKLSQDGKAKEKIQPNEDCTLEWDGEDELVEYAILRTELE